MFKNFFMNIDCRDVLLQDVILFERIRNEPIIKRRLFNKNALDGSEEDKHVLSHLAKVTRLSLSFH